MVNKEQIKKAVTWLVVAFLVLVFVGMYVYGEGISSKVALMVAFGLLPVIFGKNLDRVSEVFWSDDKK